MIVALERSMTSQLVSAIHDCTLTALGKRQDKLRCEIREAWPIGTRISHVRCGLPIRPPKRACLLSSPEFVWRCFASTRVCRAANESNRREAPPARAWKAGLRRSLTPRCSWQEAASMLAGVKRTEILPNVRDESHAEVGGRGHVADREVGGRGHVADRGSGWQSQRQTDASNRWLAGNLNLATASPRPRHSATT